MIKIKEIDQQYTMQEITAIVDELYPFGEYKTQEDERYIYIESRNFEFDHKKKALMKVFFTLNKCNRVIAGQYTTPLTPEECERIVSDRESAYKQLQAIINPIRPQLQTIKNTKMEQRAFERAIEAGVMEITDSGYRWKRTKVQLAYFVNLVYMAAIPYKKIESLFGVSRIDSALAGWRRGKNIPKWASEIDALVEGA